MRRLGKLPDIVREERLEMGNCVTFASFGIDVLLVPRVLGLKASKSEAVLNSV